MNDRTNPMNGKGMKRPNGELTSERQIVGYHRNEYLDPNKRPKYIGIIPTIPSTFAPQLPPFVNQLRKPTTSHDAPVSSNNTLSATVPNQQVNMNRSLNETIRHFPSQVPLVQPHMAPTGYFISPAVFLPHYQVAPPGYVAIPQHARPIQHPHLQNHSIQHMNGVEIKYKPSQPQPSQPLDKLDQQASQLLVTYESTQGSSAEKKEFEVKEERLVEYPQPSKDWAILTPLPSSVPSSSAAGISSVKKEGSSDNRSEQKSSKINGSISTTISQNQGDSSLELGYLRKEKNRMKKILTTISASTSSSNPQTFPPAQLGLFCLESEKSVLQEGIVRVLSDRVQEELDLADIKATNFHDNAFSLQILKHIVREEQQHLNLNDISTNNLFLNALAKLGELFVLELTARALCEQENSLASITTTPREEQSKFRLSRDHVMEALRSVDYYDLFLEHF